MQMVMKGLYREGIILVRFMSGRLFLQIMHSFIQGDFFYLHKMKFGHQIKLIHLMLRSKLGKVKFERKQSSISQKGNF